MWSLDDLILDVQTSIGLDVQLAMSVMLLNSVTLKREQGTAVATMSGEMLNMLKEKNQTMSSMNMDAKRRNSENTQLIIVIR